MKVKKNDNVIVITGADRGKSGKVLHAIPKMDKIVVEGVNIKKKRRGPRKQGEKGQTVEFAAPIHVSNVKLADTKSKKKSIKKAK